MNKIRNSIIITLLSIFTCLVFSNQVKAQCHTSVNCPVGDEFQDVKRSVGKIYLKINNEWVVNCSGSLINVAGMPDNESYFITAEHCFNELFVPEINNLNLVTDVKILWGEEVGCEDVDDPYNELNVTTGVEIIVKQRGTVGSLTDIMLLKLLGDPRQLPSFDPYYNAWNSEVLYPNDLFDVLNEPFTGIHYPGEKKLSISHTEYVKIKGEDENACLYDIDYSIVAFYRRDEQTRGGSSGSPLFITDNTGQNIIKGVFSCGFFSEVNCANDNTLQNVHYADFNRSLLMECTEPNPTLKCSPLKISSTGIEYNSISGMDDLCPLRLNVIPDCNDRIRKCYLRAEILEGNAPFTYEWIVNGEVVSTSASAFVNYYNSIRKWTLTVTDSNGCTSIVKFDFEGIYPIPVIGRREESRKDNNLSIENFVIYPNPIARGNFKIEYPKGRTITEVNVQNVQGKKVLVKKVTTANENTISVNIDDLASGIYFVQLIDENHFIQTEKIIVTK